MYFLSERYLSKSISTKSSFSKNISFDHKGEVLFCKYRDSKRADICSFDKYMWHHQIRESIGELKTRLDSLKDESKKIKKLVYDGLLMQQKDFFNIQKEIEKAQKPSGNLSIDIATTKKFLEKSKTVLKHADKTLAEYEEKKLKIQLSEKFNCQKLLTGLVSYLHIGAKKFTDSHKKLKNLYKQYRKISIDPPKPVRTDASWLPSGSLKKEKERKIEIIISSTIIALVISLGVSAYILGTDYVWESITEIIMWIIAAVVGVVLFFAGPWGIFFGIGFIGASLMGIHEAMAQAPFLIAFTVICIAIPLMGYLWATGSEHNLTEKWNKKVHEANSQFKKNEKQWLKKQSIKYREMQDAFEEFKSTLLDSIASGPDFSSVDKDDLEKIEEIITDWNNEIDQLISFDSEVERIFSSIKLYRTKNQRYDRTLDTLQTTWAQHS